MRQFEWIRTGRRRNADSRYGKTAFGASTARDVAAVMDYVSRLVPPPGKLAEQGWVNPDFPSYSRANLPRDRGNQMPLPGVPPRYSARPVSLTRRKRLELASGASVLLQSTDKAPWPPGRGLFYWGPGRTAFERTTVTQDMLPYRFICLMYA